MVGTLEQNLCLVGPYILTQCKLGMHMCIYCLAPAAHNPAHPVPK